MKIFFDIQPAMAQQAGIGRYTRLLVQNLSEIMKDEDLLLFFFDFKRKGVPFSLNRAIQKPVRWCPGRIFQLAWKTIGWPPVNWLSERADLYHFPNYVLPPLTTGKSVVSIHDMSFMIYPQYSEEKNRRYLTAKIKDTVARTDAIITGSRFSGDEMSELLKISPDRIFPVYHGISEDFVPATAEQTGQTMKELGIEPPYILTVGTLEPRKNTVFLIDIFEKLDKFDGQLVIAGMPGWKYGPILERIKNSPAADRIHYVRYVSDSQLPPLYSGADLFVFPSFYEGFGFPPLESMACGTPVVSANGGSLAEILGDAAIVLDNYDLDRWIESVNMMLYDTGLREKYIRLGKEQAGRFTWRNSAEETLKVYKKLA